MVVYEKRVEVYTNKWVNVTPDVLGEGTGQSIEIHRGGRDELGDTAASATFTLKNASKYYPSNPGGPYYGYFGRNTPVRVSVLPHFTSGSGADVSDQFGRTVASNWGFADVPGTDYYVKFGTGIALLASDWNVSGGKGHLALTVNSIFRASLLNYLCVTDVDAYATAQLNIAAVTGVGSQVEPLGIIFRAQSDGSTYTAYYLVRVEVAQTGTVVLRVTYEPAGTNVGYVVLPLVVTGQALRMHARIIGNEISASVWNDGSAEPTDWQLVVHDTTLGYPGYVGVRSAVSAGNTNAKPLDVQWDNVSFTPIFVRFAGEISGFPVQFNGPNMQLATIPVSANGVLARLNQGTKTATTALERMYVSMNPILLWTLDAGSDSTTGGVVVNNGTFGWAPPGNVGLTIGTLDAGKVSGPPAVDGSYPQLCHDITDIQVAAAVSLTGSTGTSYTLDHMFVAEHDPAATIWYCYTLMWSDTNGNLANVVIGGDATNPLAPTYYAGVQSFQVSNPGSTFVGANITGTDFIDGKWHHVRVVCLIDTVTITVDDVYTASGTNAGTAFSNVTSVGVADNRTPDMTSVSVGQVALFSGYLLASTYPAFQGHAGDTLAGRLGRLASQESISVVVDDSGASVQLTTQPKASTVELMQGIADTDCGLLYETRNSDTLSYTALNRMYNLPKLVLDYAASHLSEGFQPGNPDTANVWNAVTVERWNAAIYRVLKSQGKLNVSPPPVGIGKYDLGKRTVFPATDYLLADIGNWLLLLGTVDSPRYPSVPVGLHRSPFTASQQLAYGTLMADVGHRLVLTNLPSVVGSDPADTLIRGYDETISNTTHDISFFTTPYGPYQLAATDGVARVCADGDIVTSKAILPATTTLYVASMTGNSAWCTATSDPWAAGDFPMAIHIGGELASCTASAVGATDTFTRTTAAGWGTTDSGETWTVLSSPGAATDYSTNGSVGRMDVNARGSANQRAVKLGVSWRDVDFTVTVQSGGLPTPAGQSATIALYLRYLNDSNYVQARLFLNANNTVTAALRQLVGGVETFVGFPVVQNITPTTQLRYRFQAFGSVIKHKAWSAASSEPSGWSQVQTGITYLTEGDLRIGCELSGSSTNALPYTFTWDDLVVTVPQRLTVVRGSSAYAWPMYTVVDVVDTAHTGK